MSGGRTLQTTTAPRPDAQERDRVIAWLTDAFAQGALEVDEFERRVGLAQTGSSTTELQALTADLSLAPPSGAPAPAPARSLVPEAQVRRSATVVSVMGGTRRTGAWTVPRKLKVVALMGGSQLDFREAHLPAGRIDVHVMALMGGVELIVPPHLAVEAQGLAVMGGFEHVERAPKAPEPGQPVLRVTGVAIMGGVSIEMRLPGETEREARKRRRKERRNERR
jgi:hypothetical protein